MVCEALWPPNVYSLSNTTQNDNLITEETEEKILIRSTNKEEHTATKRHQKPDLYLRKTREM